MRAAVIVFPGSNCDRDVAVALTDISGQSPCMVWHKDTQLPKADLVVLPGGFSYGDYLRAGSLGAVSPIMGAVKRHAQQGRIVLGICNGFQILTETHLLPGVLMRNINLEFICRHVPLRVIHSVSPFTSRYAPQARLSLPIAHHDGNYQASPDVLERLEGEGQILFRYDGDPPNGAAAGIAGIRSERGNILGMMPHPERATDPHLGEPHGRPLFQSLLEALS